MRGVVGVVGAILVLAGLGALASGAFVVEGLWLIALGVAGVAVMLLERGRYRTREEARASGAFRATGEVFVDPTTGQRTRVLIDPATGERRYEPIE